MGLLSVLPMPHAGFFPSHSFNPNILNCLEHLPTSYGLTALKEWYISADPLHPALLFCAFSSLMVWIVGELTGKYFIDTRKNSRALCLLGCLCWLIPPDDSQAVYTVIDMTVRCGL